MSRSAPVSYERNWGRFRLIVAGLSPPNGIDFHDGDRGRWLRPDRKWRKRWSAKCCVCLSCGGGSILFDGTQRCHYPNCLVCPHCLAAGAVKAYRLNRPLMRVPDVVLTSRSIMDNEYGFRGYRRPATAINTLVAAAPDAIQLTVGQARLLQSIPGRQKPSLVLRTDVANVYGKDLPRTLFSRMIEDPVEQALRLDAACVVVNLFLIPNEPEVTDQCVGNILRIKPQCDRYAMPLMIEPLVFRPNASAGGYMVDGDPRKIIPLAGKQSNLVPDVSGGSHHT